ncbi:MAG: CPBP family intramembrane glutamic endopeptidase, partial [Salinimicrobium sp.]
TFACITATVWWDKKMLEWSWSDLGLGKPRNWWQPLLVAAAFYGSVTLFIKYVAPYIIELGGRPGRAHLQDLAGNLPMLVTGLFVVWVTAAFLEELIFRAYLINVLDKLFGSTKLSAAAAVLVSAVIFGLSHAYQGLTGILLTGSLGLLAGIFFLLNGRRIWPLILIHGLIDTISFIHIYNM